MLHINQKSILLKSLFAFARSKLKIRDGVSDLHTAAGETVSNDSDTIFFL